MSTPGWYPDPAGRFEFRWFDGNGWTPAVSRGGVQTTDPLGSVSTAPVAQTLPPLPPVAGVPRPGSSSIDLLVEPPAPSRSNVPLLVAAGVGLLAVAAAAVFVVSSDGGDKGSAVAASIATVDTVGATVVMAPSTIQVVEGSPGDATSRPVIVSGAPLPPFESTSSDPAVGMPAPVLQGYTFDGVPISIDAATDGPYIVVFLAHWCPHCNREIPRLLEWQASGNVPSGLNVVAVATAVSEGAPNYPPREWLESKGWTWPAMIDESQGAQAAGVAATAYGATGWPYFVIVGADGLVKARHAGEIERADLQRLVETALAG